MRFTEALDGSDLHLDRLQGEIWDWPILGSELRDQTRPIELSLYFQEADEAERWRPVLEEITLGLELHFTELKVEAVDSIDWHEHWKQHFQPIQFGSLWVVPTWLDIPEAAQHVLRIDPSMAFGTGLHETTALCVERLGRFDRMSRVLDVGTGTGILAMAALRLGATQAVGTDIDPDAIRVARENAEINGLGDRLRFFQGSLEDISETYPLVVANILAGPLSEMALALSRKVAKGGFLVLSGILETQSEALISAYTETGLRFAAIESRGPWVRIDFQRE